MTVCFPDWMAGVLLLGAIFRAGLRDWFEHSPRFQNGAEESPDGDGSG